MTDLTLTTIDRLTICDPADRLADEERVLLIRDLRPIAARLPKFYEGLRLTAKRGYTGSPRGGQSEFDLHLTYEAGELCVIRAAKLEDLLVAVEVVEALTPHLA